MRYKLTNEEIREKIACPQFGDDHYGEWGALRDDQREIILQLLEKAIKYDEIMDRRAKAAAKSAANRDRNKQAEICRKAIAARWNKK